MMEISESGGSKVYLDFYNLKEAPFSITPDPEFLFLSGTHQSVLDKILYGINSRIGFLVLFGEVGTGKTTICRSVLDSLDGKAELVYIINPSITGKELISSILDDLQIEYAPDSSKKDLIDSLNSFLLSVAPTRPVVVIIDDAQTVPVDTLENLRLLSNLETDKEKLLQIVLVGQPELLDLISRPEVRQLKQRVAITCHLKYLAREEVGGYISRRLFIAGENGRISFSKKATKQIYNASNGIPRVINKICDYALTAGYISNDFTIGTRYVQKALQELGDQNYQGRNFNKKYQRSKSLVKRSILFPAACVMVFALILIFLWPYNLNIDNLSIFKKKRDILPDSVSDAGFAVYKQKISKKKPAGKSDLKADSITGSSAMEKNPAVSSDLLPKEITDENSPDLYPFALLAGSFKSLDATIKAVSFYKTKGVEVHWHHVNLGAQGVWYRLFTGRFKTKAGALQYKKDHSLDQSIVLFSPWTVLINPSGSIKDIEQTISELKANQYDSYIIKNGNGSDRFCAGIFTTRKGAEDFAQELNNKNITARVIPR